MTDDKSSEVSQPRVADVSPARVARVNPARVRPQVRGVDLDERSRCAHYHGELDIIAIRVRCCGEFYACKECHDELADHPLAAWPREMFHESAVLCAECGVQLRISAYLACGNRCPECGAGFNPRCSLHHHFYFSAG